MPLNGLEPLAEGTSGVCRLRSLSWSFTQSAFQMGKWDKPEGMFDR